VASYLDASALVKLVVREPESEALRRFLKRRPDRISSALSRVEVIRAVRFHGPLAATRAARVLERVRILKMDDGILSAAAALYPRVLRSLDAIHLASAQALGQDLEEVVTYDRRMTAAAAVIGVPARAPGASWEPTRGTAGGGRS
jgi:predicted nucleic acid-binding protein